ncbi:hypothetical protein D3C72_1278190 [compost metagenome]
MFTQHLLRPCGFLRPDRIQQALMVVHDAFGLAGFGQMQPAQAVQMAAVALLKLP